MFRFGRSSRLNLMGVHPDLVLVFSRVLLYSPIDFKITEGLRNIDRQRYLVAEGLSHTMNSMHLPQPDGFAHALDIMPVGDLDKDGDVDAHDKSITWDRPFFETINESVQRGAKELRIPTLWGGLWVKSFGGKGDCPHFQLHGG